jgi:nucleoid-associated protein YgaU
MFTSMISRFHLLVAFLVLALAVGLGWAGFEWSRDRFADKSNAPGAPASEQTAAGGRQDGSAPVAPAAPSQVATDADRSAAAPGGEPAAPQQRQPATKPAPRVDPPHAAPTAPELAARDRAAPPEEAVTASRTPTPVEPPAGQPDRQVEALVPSAEPPSPTPEAAPAPSPVAPPPSPAVAGVTEPAAEEETGAAAPSGTTDLAKEDVEHAAPPEATAASKPTGASRAPQLAAPAPEAVKRPEPETAPAPPADRATVALSEPKSVEPKMEPGPAGPEAEPALGSSGNAPAPPDEPVPQQTARPQDQERRDQPRSAPARAAETLKRAITSLFGGATDSPAPAKTEEAPKAKEAPGTKEAEVAALPDRDAPASERSGAPAEVDPGAAPTFDIVRIEPRGQAVMAGRAAPGAEVEIRSGDRLIDRARADQRGEWVVVPAEPLARGVQELRLSARVENRPAIESEEVLVVAIPDPPPPEPALRLPDDVLPEVAAAAPADQAFAVAVPREGTGKGRILQAPGRISGEGALALVMLDYDDAGRIRLSGEGAAGAALRIYVNNQPAGVTMVGPSGRWDAVLEGALKPGDYTLRLDQLDLSGKPDARLETPFTRVGHPPVAGDVEVDYVIVQPGNSLWRIARRVLGEGLRYVHIYEVNQAQIRNPHLIYPGQVFEIPSSIDPAG